MDGGPCFFLIKDMRRPSCEDINVGTAETKTSLAKQYTARRETNSMSEKRIIPTFKSSFKCFIRQRSKHLKSIGTGEGTSNGCVGPSWNHTRTTAVAGSL